MERVAPETAVESIQLHREIVSFRAAGQDFCIDIGLVREIRGWTPTTLLPRAPDFVTGVMNLRGNVIPVIDLALRLGLGRTEPTERHVIVIANLGGGTVGLLVEAVSDIITVEAEGLRPTPEVAGGGGNGFVEGVFTVEDALIRALDLSRVLPAAEKPLEDVML
ncbi:chemotaxis protein CheW [Rhodosalinus sp. 5P4]|uniref:chemotaxis protein CheW n=1 Tax=Rhodosalinus sp. 5P4 TaxID=3239196 RepID=UPI0035234BA3